MNLVEIDSVVSIPLKKHKFRVFCDIDSQVIYIIRKECYDPEYWIINKLCPERNVETSYGPWEQKYENGNLIYQRKNFPTMISQS